MPTGLGDEKLWISATNDNTGTSTAFDDQSGNGNNGTASGTLVVANTSEGGTYAYDFDGVNDRINLPSGIQSALGTSTQSFSVWFKRDAATGNGGIIGLGTDASRQMWAFGNISSNDVYYDGISIGPVSTGSWRHVVGTIDGTNVRLYLNGVLMATGTATQPIPSGSSTKNFIGHIDGFGYFDGLMDDIRIYDRALTQAEITHLASSRGVEGPAPVGLGDEKLWWVPTHSNDLFLDSSSSGHSVTNQGTAPTLVADTDAGGQYAGQFAATGSVRVEDGFEFLSTGDFSMSGWIKSATSARMVFGGQQAGGYDSDKSGGMIDQNSGVSRARFISGGGDANDLLTTTSAVPNNTWHHVTATREGSDCKVYVNGVLAGTKTISGYPSNPDYKDLMIGGLWNGGQPLNVSTGYMDDIRIYDRSLTQAEITHLASSRGVEGSPDTCDLLTDMTFWSDLDDGTSSSLSDDNGGSDVLTRNGGTTDATGSPRSSACVAYGTSAGNYHLLNNGANIPAPPSEYSVSVWCKFDSASSVGNWVVSQRDASTGDHWQIFRWNAGNIGVYELGSVDRSVEVASSLGQWYHVSFSRTDAAFKVYINGSLAGTDTTAMTQNTGASPIALGTPAWDQGSAGLHHNGDVWGFGMWDRALTATEHALLHAEGQGLLYSEICPTPSAGLYNAFITHAFKQLFQTRLR